MSRRADLDLIIGWKDHYSNEDIKNTIKRYWDGKREGLSEKAVIELGKP